MFIERTSKEIISRLPASVDADDLQEFLGYARYKEPQQVVDSLAADVSRKWYAKNHKRLLK